MYCPQCGAAFPAGADTCQACNAPIPKTDNDASSGARFLIPINTEVCSIVSFYLAMVGFFTCGLSALAAIPVGVASLVRLKSRPRMFGRSRAVVAIALGLIQTLLFAWVWFMMLTTP